MSLRYTFPSSPTRRSSLHNNTDSGGGTSRQYDRIGQNFQYFFRLLFSAVMALATSYLDIKLDTVAKHLFENGLCM